MITLFSLFAEIEQQLISQCVHFCNENSIDTFEQIPIDQTFKNLVKSSFIHTKKKLSNSQKKSMSLSSNMNFISNTINISMLHLANISSSKNVIIEDTSKLASFLP